MGECKILILSDVTASKFFHLPNYEISTRCPYCGEYSKIRQVGGESASSIPDELMKIVGYPKVAECSRCQRKMVTGFKL